MGRSIFSRCTRLPIHPAWTSSGVGWPRAIFSPIARNSNFASSTRSSMVRPSLEVWEKYPCLHISSACFWAILASFGVQKTGASPASLRASLVNFTTMRLRSVVHSASGSPLDGARVALDCSPDTSSPDSALPGAQEVCAPLPNSINKSRASGATGRLSARDIFMNILDSIREILDPIRAALAEEIANADAAKSLGQNIGAMPGAIHPSLVDRGGVGLAVGDILADHRPANACSVDSVGQVAPVDRIVGKIIVIAHILGM